MSKKLILSAIIVVLAGTYLTLSFNKKSDEISNDVTPVQNQTVVQPNGMPVPDLSEEVVVEDIQMPDPEDVSPVDEEITGGENTGSEHNHLPVVPAE